MADIKKELNDIKNAVYGREVRSSIHDGIKKINEESEESKQKADDAYEITQDLLDETFDSSLLEANFEQRLDDEIANLQPEWTSFKNDVTSQLAQKANQSEVNNINNQVELAKDRIRMRSYLKYGNIELPDDFFHNINFNIYRDYDGKMKHDFYLDAFLNRWDATHLYVDGVNGDVNADGTDKNNPTAQLVTALNTANNGTGTHYIIHIISKYIDKDRSSLPEDYQITKNIAIIAEEEVFIGNLNSDGPWVEELGLLKRIRSNVRSVYDRKFRTIAGLPKRYVKVNSIAECQNTPGSFYTDGTLIYINRIDGTVPVENEVMLSLGDNAIRSYSFTLTDDVTFVMKNITSIQKYGNVDNIRISSTGTTKGHVIFENVKCLESGGNGIGTNGIKHTWLFNCATTDTDSDGFNYHNTISGNHFIFEYDCTAFNCGVNSSSNNNNATTGHEEAYILRVNSKGWNTKGPVLADVNGCYSICYDCAMNDSIRTEHPTEKTAYQFANVAYGDDKGKNGKAILINCEGGGIETGLLTTGGSFEKVQVLNLRGDYSKIVNTNIEFIE